MAWFWLALGAHFLFSVGTHVDKHLLSRYFREAAPGSLILFSAVFGFVVAPVALAIDPRALSMSPSHAALVVVGGLLNITAVILYLYALARDEASVVAPLFQLFPLFSYALAFAILGETLAPTQMLGCALVIAGAVVVSVDLRARRLKAVVLGLMAAATLFLATNAVLFKKVGVEDRFWASTFWSYASLALAGVLLFCFAPVYRRQFLRTLRENRAPVIAINAANEILAVAGYLMISYATLLAPIALVSVVGGFQPLMVFLLGFLIAAFAPRSARNPLSRAQIVQSLVAIALVAGGTALLHLGAG